MDVEVPVLLLVGMAALDIIAIVALVEWWFEK